MAVVVSASCEASIEVGSIGPVKISGGCGSYAPVLTAFLDPTDVWYVITVTGWESVCCSFDEAIANRRKEECGECTPADPN